MVQRSRIAQASDLRSFGKRGGGKAMSGPTQAALKHGAVLVFLAALVCVMPMLYGPGFFHDQARSAAGLALAIGEWVRDGLVAGFQSIPVR